MKKINLVSLFSGAGGLDIGFQQAGYNCILATDNWNIACDTLKKNNISKKIICDDIRNIDFEKIIGNQRVDCVIGGPPCPPYSQTRHYLIGKKDGFADEKAGFAVPEYFRVIEELNPKIFVFENVDGFSFKTHKSELEFLNNKSKELGYVISYKVINCANYGVPQTRKRFICVGVQKGLNKFVFPEELYSEKGEDGKKKWITCGEVLSDFDNINEEEKFQKPGSKDYDLFVNIPPGDNYLYYTEKRGYPNPKFKWKSRYWTFLLKLTPDRPSWTIQASFSNNQGPFHWKNRFLRIEELKRLQTFPDDYELSGDFKDQWRQLGNAVPSLIGKIIGEKIKEDYFDE